MAAMEKRYGIPPESAVCEGVPSLPVQVIRERARARNRPRPGIALFVIAVVTFLVVLAARASAQPAVVTGAGDTNEAEDELEDLDDVDGAEAASALTAPVPHGKVDLARDAELYVAIAARAPSPHALVCAGYRVAGLDHDPGTGLTHRARAAALIPWVQVRVGEDASWRDVIDPTVGHVSVWAVSATWHLDRLVLDSTDVRAVSLSSAFRRDRRRLASRIVKIYYRWLRARVVAERSGRPSPRADEAAAELDELTGGAFAGGVKTVSCQGSGCPPRSD